MRLIDGECHHQLCISVGVLLSLASQFLQNTESEQKTLQLTN